MAARTKPVDAAIEVRRMEAEMIERKIAQFRNIYRDAFTTPPWDEPAVHAMRFGRHLKEISNEPGFRCVVAAKATGGMVGFAFGYPPQANLHLLETLGAGLGPVESNRLLPGSFYLAELAVIGSVQRRGLGGRLHDELLRECRHARALATAREDTPGYRLFLARGWEAIAEIPEFYHPGEERVPWLPAVLLTRPEPGG